MKFPYKVTDQPTQRNFDYLARQPALAVLEALHVIGAAGEPAFQNGWGNYAPATFGLAGFYKNNGRVYLRGLLSQTLGIPTINSAMFTLPPGYRPGVAEVCVVQTGEPNGPGRVDVSTAGVVQWVSGQTTETDYTSLNSVSFLVA